MMGEEAEEKAVGKAGKERGELREVGFFRALAKASDAELICIQIPETFLVGDSSTDPIFLFTDKSGSLHCIRGPQYGII